MKRLTLRGYESNLQWANLMEAKISSGALREAFSLAGATMPDGSVYEPTDGESAENDDGNV